MEVITVSEHDTLIIETDLLLHPETLKRIQKSLLEQMKMGVVIIPAGFTYKHFTRKQQEGES